MKHDKLGKEKQISYANYIIETKLITKIRDRITRTKEKRRIKTRTKRFEMPSYRTKETCSHSKGKKE